MRFFNCLFILLSFWFIIGFAVKYYNAKLINYSIIYQILTQLFFSKIKHFVSKTVKKSFKNRTSSFKNITLQYYLSCCLRLGAFLHITFKRSPFLLCPSTNPRNSFRSTVATFPGGRESIGMSHFLSSSPLSHFITDFLVS